MDGFITLEQAREAGYTASQLRTISRSLRRIATKGYSEDEKSYTPGKTMAASYHLFNLSRKL